MKTLRIDDLEFELRESSRRRTIEIIIDRDGSLALAAPTGTRQETLTGFVGEKLDWIYTKLLEKESQARPRAPKEYVSGEGFPYLGRSYRLKVADGVRQDVPLRLYRSRFELRPDEAAEARDHFVAWYSAHLRPVLARHIAALSPRVGASPEAVHVRDMGFKWGSCDRRDHVYFHWRVAMVPHTMIEYLVAHELVHLLEPSHTAAFWERLERVIPDHPDRQRWLREHGGTYDL